MSNTRSASWCSLALVVVLAACGSSSGSSKSSDTNASSNTPSKTTSDESNGTSASGGEKKIDACSLLSDAEAQSILGETVTKKGPASGVGESVCEWDTATSNSVTIGVGTPGTAPADKLTLDPILGKAEPVAALNGKGFYVGGQVRFAAGNRDNYVQVVTAAGGGGSGDRPKAEQLAVKLAPKIAQ